MRDAFNIRTHRWDDWSLEDLVHAKKKSGETISVVLPARDEVATIGGIVSRLRTCLVDDVPLLDEVIVIDSDSSDDTFVAATEAGASVHRSREIRSDLGSLAGKGEALWKSLFVARGSLLVFMDADLLDWDVHFVQGLVGPLLHADEVQLVKGFYERPLRDGRVDPELEGGRVTELMARPLISTWYPHLAGIVQPLAGEWAIRRDAFEGYNVPAGYGVELAALIDTSRLHGLGGIAQVNLGRRTHRHHPLTDLGAMAVQVLAAAESRHDREGERQTVRIRQFKFAQGSVLETEVNVSTTERPPARNIGVPRKERGAT